MEEKERESLEELLRQARKEYQICWNYFDNCDKEMIEVALYNLRICEKKIKHLNDALKLNGAYSGNW